MSNLFKNYLAEIEVLTPLHIGKGIKLQRNADFIFQNGFTYRLNTDNILDDFWPDDKKQQQLLLRQPVGELVKDQLLANSPRYVQYQYRGNPAMNEVYEHIKDPFGQAYIPGSTLKGALRTLLLRTIIEGIAQKEIKRGDIGPAMHDGRDINAAKTAAARLEGNYAGPDANHSLFRGIAISDTTPTKALSLQNIQMVPKLQVDVEAIPMNTKLKTSIRLDRYLLEQKRDEIGFEAAWAKTILNFVRAANFTAQKRVEHELKYHVKNEDAQATHFYHKLKQAIQQPEFQKSTFVLQIGFATGWRAKTLLGDIPNDAPLLDDVINDFALNRGGGKGHTGIRQPGDTFPKARHLTMNNGRSALPLGWVKVRIESI